MNNSKLYLLLLLILINLAVGFRILSQVSFFGHTGIDDAYIYLTYAQNFLAGHGFVWNAGSERVEGFTSPLWLMLTIAAAFFSNDPFGILFFVNVLLISFASYLLLSLLDDYFIKERLCFWKRLLYAVMFNVLLLSEFGYSAWAFTSFMETPLWIVLVVAEFYLLFRVILSDSKNIGLFFLCNTALLIFARPEGLGVAATTMGLLLLFKIKDYKSGLRLFLPLFFVVLLSVFCLTLFRSIYFSQLLPNTYYAKVGADFWFNLKEGYKYFQTWRNQTTNLDLYLIVGALFSLLACFLWRAQRFVLLAMFTFPLSFFCMYTYLGGDHFVFSRHYQAVFPIVIFILLASVAKTCKPLLGLVIVILITLIQYTDLPMKSRVDQFKYEHELAAYGKLAGTEFNNYFPNEKPYIAAVAVGGIASAYEGNIFDVMGLNDTELAHHSRERYGTKNHAAFNADLFVARQPDLLLHFGRNCSRDNELLAHPFMNQALKNLSSNQQFRREYFPFWMPDGLNLKDFAPEFPFTKAKLGYCGYVRKDFYIKTRSLIPYKVPKQALAEIKLLN